MAAHLASRSSVRSWPVPFTILLFAAWLLPLAGCLHRQPVVSVPVLPSAAEQYKYTISYRSDSNLPLIHDPKKLAIQRQVVRDSFSKLIEYFPQDRQFTPLAKLEIIELDAGMDDKRVKVSHHDETHALHELDRLARAYPEFDYLQAKVLYDQGMIHKRLGEFPKAQERFKQLRDRFANNTDATIAYLVKQADLYYKQTYVNE